ncbi:MAG: GNAT family N-acetyltransferase, partial [Mariprofundales bacterium]|nr:GNAT family N-acetyltransferase [Mariprofundales bacterium]
MRLKPAVTPQLRAAGFDDLPQIAALGAEALPEAWSSAALESSLTMEYHTLIVATRRGATRSDEQHLVGYYLSCQVARDVELLQLVVAPVCRRQRVGSYLLRHLIAAAAPFDHITLEVRASNSAA